MPFYLPKPRALWHGTQQFLLRRRLDPLPLLRTLRHYNADKLRNDARAGLEVALLGLPQGMAFALIAGLPLVYGVMGAAVAPLIAPWFSSSRHTSIGPTNATAFMIFSYFAVNPVPPAFWLMPLVVLMAGLILVAGAFLRLADFATYISRSVIVGYITGAAVLMIANQCGSALGLDLAVAPAAAAPAGFALLPAPATLPVAPKTFFTVVWHSLQRLDTLQWSSALLSAATLILYYVLKHKMPRWPVFALVLITMSVAAYFMRLMGMEVRTFGNEGFSASGLLPAFPQMELPVLFGAVNKVAGLALAVAFLAALENSMMAKTLGSQAGERTDLNQDMLGLGLANVGCAFLSGMPASGSLTRSALNFSSGAVTGVSSLITGGLCLIGALTLGPYVSLLPKAVLATLVVANACSLINRRHIRIAWQATPEDALTFVATLICTLLLPLHVAIFVGVGVSIALFVRKTSQPHLVEYEFNSAGALAEARQRQHPFISIVHVEGTLFFGAADIFRSQIMHTCRDPSLKVIILRLKNAHHLDATSVMALEELVRFLRSKDRHVLISGAMKQVYRVLKNSGLVDVIGRENIFPGSPSNPNISTRNALKRAQAILGETTKAEVRIFFDPDTKGA